VDCKLPRSIDSPRADYPGLGAVTRTGTSKFSEMRIVGILKDAESGIAVNDLLRKHGVSRATSFEWRNKYGGASVSERRVRWSAST
jgi:hypothetical protein